MVYMKLRHTQEEERAHIRKYLETISIHFHGGVILPQLQVSIHLCNPENLLTFLGVLKETVPVIRAIMACLTLDGQIRGEPWDISVLLELVQQMPGTSQQY